jgi:hypothetical protein
MTSEDLAHEFRTLISSVLPPARYRAMRLLLARQAALRVAGARHRAYFRKYKARLIADAVELIASQPRFARYQNLKVGR